MERKHLAHFELDDGACLHWDEGDVDLSLQSVPTNTRKSIGQLVWLLHALSCDVKLVVTRKKAA
jgi:hypothetical protein